MKKVLFLSVLLFLLLFHVTVVRANSGPPVKGINVVITECTYDDDDNMIYENNFDILVLKDEAKKFLDDTITTKYKTQYPFYEDIDYLNRDDNWVSYSAYSKDGDWGYNEYDCGFIYGDNDLVDAISKVRFVYFDDEGNTLFLSDEFNVPDVYFWQKSDSIIYFDTNTYHITDDLDHYTNPYLFLGVILIGILILFSVGIETLIAVIMKFRHIPGFILNVILLNITTQILMYIFFYALYDAFNMDYTITIIIVELIILITEGGYLLWKFRFDELPKQKIILFVVIANAVSYFLGISNFV